VMPSPVTNAEFTQILARVVHRPAMLPAPAWSLRLLLGDLSTLLLDSQRIVPGRFTKLGYAYQSPTVQDALERVFRLPG
jgi:NAD dependent epimerase/dehydratase family enzyme